MLKKLLSPLTLRYAVFVIFLFLFSCRKDNFLPDTPKAKIETENIISVGNVTIETVSYTSFKKKAPGNVRSYAKNYEGDLKAGSTGAIMNIEDGVKVGLNMDEVKVLTVDNKTSYVFSFNPATTYATSFQTLTIEETDHGVKQFVTVYHPTKKWINEWRQGIKTQFEGKTVFYEITEPAARQNNPGSVKERTGSIATSDGLATLVLSCTSFNIYDAVPVKCSSVNNTTISEPLVTQSSAPKPAAISATRSVPNATAVTAEAAACWKMVSTTVMLCSVVDVDMEGAGFGGVPNGGSSNTLPYVPSNYYPCQKVENPEEGTTVDNPCDNNGYPSGYNPAIAMRVHYIDQAVGLTQEQKDFLYAQPSVLSMVEQKLQDEDIITENLKSAIEFIRVLFSGYYVYGGVITEQNLDAVLTASLPLSYAPFKNLFLPYLRMQVALEFQADQGLNPNSYWDAATAYFRAYDEVINMALDMGGMAPVVGEIFDVASGLKYGLQGDYMNASISAVSALPVLGNIPASARIIKNGRKVIAMMDQAGVWRFPRRSLRAGLGMAKISVDSRIGHHVLPLKEHNHPLVQKAIYDKFDLNDASINGAPVNPTTHTGAMDTYSNNVRLAMDDLMVPYGNDINNIDPQTAKALLIQLSNRIKLAINNAQFVHLDNLIF